MRKNPAAVSSRLALLFATCLVAACGGGGSSDSTDTATAGSIAPVTPPVTAPAPGPAPAPTPAPSPSPAPSPTPSPSPSPAPAPAPTPAPAPASSLPTATCGLPNFAADALTLVNQKRAAGATCGTTVYAPAGPLVWNALLNQAATGHSADMAAQNYFSHTSKDGRSPGNRIDATGYVWQTYGENIAAGYATVPIVVNAWMASPGHCANIMNGAFTEMGLACVPGNANSTYGNYWTMDLAKPR